MIAGAAWRSCTGANAHTTRPAQPRRRRPASTSSRALPVSRAHDPDRPRQRAPRQALLRLEQALGVERAAQPVELGQQVALAGQPQSGHRERERRRGGARADVVGRTRRRRRPAAVGDRRLDPAPRSPRATSSTAARRRASRSSNQTFARPTLKPKTSPNTCTRANPRRRSRSAAAYWPTGHGPVRSEPGIPAGRWTLRTTLTVLAGARIAAASARTTARARPAARRRACRRPRASKAASRVVEPRGRRGDRHRVDQLVRQRRRRALARALEVAAAGTPAPTRRSRRARRARRRSSSRASPSRRGRTPARGGPRRAPCRRRSSSAIGTQGATSISARERPAVASPRSSGSSSGAGSAGSSMNGSQPSAISPVCCTAFGPTAPR